MQRLRDAKRAQVFEVYEGREGDLVTGIVQQSDHRYILMDLGNAEAVMPSGERIPDERLERGARVKALILEVRGETKGPQIVVSRSHPDFIRRLFELEVPELVEGVVEIRAIARDAGHRTKIAVTSTEPNVDPVGACVGARGSRERQVVNELRGEKVDIVEWRDDVKQFIAEALSPARVRQVILDEEEKEAIVVVPDHQLSLAIGKEGQNARLAARLSGYRIDIRSETEQMGGEVPDAEAGAEAPAAAEGDEAAPGAKETDAAATEVEGGVEAAADAEESAETEGPGPAKAVDDSTAGDGSKAAEPADADEPAPEGAPAEATEDAAPADESDEDTPAETDVVAAEETVEDDETEPPAGV